jgi:hypothetical protein
VLHGSPRPRRVARQRLEAEEKPVTIFDFPLDAVGEAHRLIFVTRPRARRLRRVRCALARVRPHDERDLVPRAESLAWVEWGGRKSRV